MSEARIFAFGMHEAINYICGSAESEIFREVNMPVAGLKGMRNARGGATPRVLGRQLPLPPPPPP